MEKIKIVFVVDDKYFKYMIVTLLSIVENTKSSILVYIICENAEKKKLDQTLAILNDEDIELKFIDYNNEKKNNFNLKKDYMSSIAYAKYDIPNLIDEDIVIYLDSDILFINDIKSLWELRNPDSEVQAVWNPGYTVDNIQIGVEKSYRNFNSGVMILNLKKWRDNNITEKLYDFTFANNNKTRLHDQPALNFVFKNNWGELPYQYNFQNVYFRCLYKDLELTKKEYKMVYEKLCIIHFTGKDKPWLFVSPHKFKKDYLRVYKRCYGKAKYENITVKLLLLKAYKALRLNYLLLKRWAISL